MRSLRKGVIIVPGPSQTAETAETACTCTCEKLRMPPPPFRVKPLYGRHRLFSELARDTHTHTFTPNAKAKQPEGLSEGPVSTNYISFRSIKRWFG
jgi:hypothetical protein